MKILQKYVNHYHKFTYQDNAYYDEPDTRRLLVTCWVPFMDTDVHNGGMGVMEGSHRLAKVGSHFGCEGDTWYVSLDKDAMERELQCAEQDERQCKVVSQCLALQQRPGCGTHST